MLLMGCWTFKMHDFFSNCASSLSVKMQCIAIPNPEQRPVWGPVLCRAGSHCLFVTLTHADADRHTDTL